MSSAILPRRGRSPGCSINIPFFGPQSRSERAFSWTSKMDSPHTHTSPPPTLTHSHTHTHSHTRVGAFTEASRDKQDSHRLLRLIKMVPSLRRPLTSGLGVEDPKSAVEI